MFLKAMLKGLLENSAMSAKPVAQVEFNPGARDGFKIGGIFLVECFDKDGNLKWREVGHNLYVDEGLDYILNVIFKGGTRSDPLYVGLTATANPDATWTMSNQGTTWNEFTGYSETTRQEFVDGAISSHRIDNSASKASFSINAAGTIYGAFLTTDSTKGGTAGTLLCVDDFATSRSVASGDTVNVTYTVGCDDDGV